MKTIFLVKLELIHQLTAPHCGISWEFMGNLSDIHGHGTNQYGQYGNTSVGFHSHVGIQELMELISWKIPSFEMDDDLGVGIPQWRVFLVDNPTNNLDDSGVPIF